MVVTEMAAMIHQNQRGWPFPLLVRYEEIAESYRTTACATGRPMPRDRFTEPRHPHLHVA